MKTINATNAGQLRKLLKQNDEERKRLLKKLHALARRSEGSAEVKAHRALQGRLIGGIMAGDTKKVARSIDVGANVNESNAEGIPPLLLAIYASAPLSIVRALIDAGSDVNATDEQGNSALIAAVRDEQIVVVKELVRRGASLNASNDEGDTALTNAACWGSEKVVRFLVQSGADVNRRDGVGISAADLARQQGHRKIASYLARVRSARK
jgi:ankyrin repeat protein